MRAGQGAAPAQWSKTPAADTRGAYPQLLSGRRRRGIRSSVLTADDRPIFGGRGKPSAHTKSLLMPGNDSVNCREQEIFSVRKQVLHRVAGESAKTRPRIPVDPSPHHASRTDAPEELRPEQPVEAW